MLENPINNEEIKNKDDGIKLIVKASEIGKELSDQVVAISGLSHPGAKTVHRGE